MCFFPRIIESLLPLPRQHSAAIGCTKNHQPIGVTVHLPCFESDVGEGGVAVNWEKTQFFLITLYLPYRWITQPRCTYLVRARAAATHQNASITISPEHNRYGAESKLCTFCEFLKNKCRLSSLQHSSYFQHSAQNYL